jgi:dimethylamine/trimethylamine dehydrogenase
MDNRLEPSKKYLQTLLKYYEEEISGEAYFYALADHFAEREKIILLARVERHAAEAVLPLLEKYGLIPRQESVIHSDGRSYMEMHQSYSWQEFMTYMTERYPGYIDDFRALEQMAPIEDLKALNKLTDHEVAVIDFAEKELAGDSDSLTPLLKYLQ